MALPRKYQGGRHLLRKLLEHAANLEEEVTWDEFNDFALAAYHLCEWVQNDPAATQAARKEVEALRKTLQIQACRDAANSYKHMRIKQYTPKTKSTDVNEAGWGIGGFGKGGFGRGEEDVVLSMVDGSKFNALDLSRQVVELWEDFFKRHFPVP
jgi:hypothetical protein